MVEEEVISKIDKIKAAAGDFRNNVAELMKGMNVKSQDWHFNVSSQENGVVVDVAVKLFISKTESKTEKK
jgi:hypothetical protein